MCPSRQDPVSDDAAAAVANALDALAILRRGRGLPGPGPGGPGGPHGPGFGPGWSSRGRHPFGPGGDDPPVHGGRASRGGRDGHDHGSERARDGDATDERAGGPRGPGGRARMMAVHRALAVLTAAGEPMSITELGAAIGIDQPRASRVVQMLQHQALVRREPDPSDARRSRIAVTAKGRAHSDAHRERRAAPVAEALAALDPAEREQLAALLGRLVDAWPRA